MPHPKLFFLALGYYTRLPCPPAPDYRRLPEASVFLPAIGWLVGGLSAAAFALADLVWPQTVAVLAALIAGILLTGAFHEDGFADVCDGLGGTVSRERALDIMKDSRLGTYGVAGLGLMLALKFAVLNALPPAWVAAALLLAHPASRLGSALLIWRMRYAREEGKAKPLGRRMQDGEFMTAAVCGLLPALILAVAGPLPAAGIGWALAAALVGAAWMARVLKRRLGGYTGDGLGAAQQLSELGCYLGVLALAV